MGSSDMVPDPVRDMLNEMLRDHDETMGRISRRKIIEAREAGTLTEKQKRTLHFPGEARMSWRYYLGQSDEKGRRVRWCYSVERNLAGYYLAWREVWDAAKGEGFRDRFTHHKLRRTARSWALRASEDATAS